MRQQKPVADEPIPHIPTLDDESTFIVVPETQDFLRVGLLGLLTGLLIPALAWLLQKFLISPIFCHDTSLAVCISGDLTTYYISTVVLSVVAIALLANWQVFRPLLIAVAAASALWGLQRSAGNTLSHAGWEYYASSGILYGLAFLLFYWLLRLKSFTLSVVLTVMAVIIIRWALLA